MAVVYILKVLETNNKIVIKDGIMCWRIFFHFSDIYPWIRKYNKDVQLYFENEKSNLRLFFFNLKIYVCNNIYPTLQNN